MKRPLCFALAIFLSCQSLIGCTSWRVQNQPPQDIVRDQHPEKVRVRLTDETTLIIEQPIIDTDSLATGEMKLTGWIKAPPSAQDSISGLENLPQQTILRPIGVPVSSINQTEVRKTSASKTLGLAFGIIIGAAVIAGIAFVEECNRTACYE